MVLPTVSHWVVLKPQRESPGLESERGRSSSPSGQLLAYAHMACRKSEVHKLARAAFHVFRGCAVVRDDERLGALKRDTLRPSTTFPPHAARRSRCTCGDLFRRATGRPCCARTSGRSALCSQSCRGMGRRVGPPRTFICPNSLGQTPGCWRGCCLDSFAYSVLDRF